MEHATINSIIQLKSFTMKKIFYLALVGVVAMAMTSCNSIDSKLNRMEKACEAGNYVKAAKISSEIEKEYDEYKLTDEQEDRYEEVSLKCSKKALKDNELDDFDF